MTSVLKVALILGAVGVKSGSTQLLTLFAEKQFNGSSHSIIFVPGSGLCQNLPSAFYDWTSSVTTEGNCISVYSFTDCKGDERRLEAGSVGHGDLEQINFDKFIRSFRPCSNESPSTAAPTTTPETTPTPPTPETTPAASTPTTTERPTRPSPPNAPFYPTPPPTQAPFRTTQKTAFPISDDAKVVFYENAGHRGKYYTIYYNTYNCYNLPVEWYDRTSAVNVSGGCINFYELSDCIEPRTQLAPGIAGLEDLQRIGLDKTIRSFQPCIIT